MLTKQKIKEIDKHVMDITFEIKFPIEKVYSPFFIMYPNDDKLDIFLNKILDSLNKISIDNKSLKIQVNKFTYEKLNITLNNKNIDIYYDNQTSIYSSGRSYFENHLIYKINTLMNLFYYSLSFIYLCSSREHKISTFEFINLEQLFDFLENY